MTWGCPFLTIGHRAEVSTRYSKIIWSATVYIAVQPAFCLLICPHFVSIDTRFCHFLYRPECDQLSGDILCIPTREPTYLTSPLHTPYILEKIGQTNRVVCCISPEGRDQGNEIHHHLLSRFHILAMS